MATGEPVLNFKKFKLSRYLSKKARQFKIGLLMAFIDF
jgi:hypothetical protein